MIDQLSQITFWKIVFPYYAKLIPEFGQIVLRQILPCLPPRDRHRQRRVACVCAYVGGQTDRTDRRDRRDTGSEIDIHIANDDRREMRCEDMFEEILSFRKRRREEEKDG